MLHKPRFNSLGVAFTVLLLLTLALATPVAAQTTDQGLGSSVFLPLIANQAQGSEEEYIIIEGDIQVPPNFFEIMASSTDATFNTQFWPNGIVPFEFDANVIDANQTSMIAAMNEWESAANIDFRQCSNNQCSGAYLHIQNSMVNSSAVGRQGGRQVVNIFNWNFRFIMAHELAHALGFWHEQSRPDREAFVQIISANIQTGQESINFPRIDAANHYGPYDFDSVMHYGQCAFTRFNNCPNDPTASNGGRTIVVKAPNQGWQGRIGQRDHLSTKDRLTMSFLYPQPNWRFVDIQHTGMQTGAFLTPYQSFGVGLTSTPQDGTLWVQPGTYSARGTYDRPLTIQAPLGEVTLQ